MIRTPTNLTSGHDHGFGCGLSAALLASVLLLPGSSRAQEPAWARVADVPLLLAQAAAGQPAAAGEAASGGVGQVTHLSGTLISRRSDGTVKLLSVKSAVNEGETLATQAGTYARVKFADGAEVVLRPTSQMKVDAYQFAEDKPGADNVVLSLLKGGLRKVTGLIGRRSREHVKVAAPNATIGIRGTHFGMMYCQIEPESEGGQGNCSAIKMPGGMPPPNGLHVDVATGAITLSNEAGSQVVNAGEFAYAPPEANVAPVVVPASRGIQVTIPPAIARNETGGRTLGITRNEEACGI